MSSDLEKEKQRLEEEARRRKEEEEVRRQVREKYEEAERRAREASERGADIAKRAAEEGSKLGEEQARKAYEEAQRKLRTATYLQTIASATSGSASGASTPAPSSGLPLTTIATPRLPVYYVIIGRGPQAIINHTTLRQTEWGKARIAGLPVLHIGFVNPWTKYMQHGMGQPPYLLNLPGFGSHPDSAQTIDGGLDSREFANVVEAEFARLRRRYGAKVPAVKESWVVWIQTEAKEPLSEEVKAELKKDGVGEGLIIKMNSKLASDFSATSSRAYYRLLLLKPKPPDLLDRDLEPLELVYAAYVDICTGPGRPILFPPKTSESQEYKLARTAPWLPPEKWESDWGNSLKARKILNAVEAIRDEITWQAGERVCVTAGGGVGLNAAERSRNTQCWLDWFGQTSLMPTFNNPRNDTILRHPTEDRDLRPGERLKPEINMDADDKLIPCSPRSRYGKAAQLAAAALSNGKVEVTLAKNGEAKIRDYYRKSADLHAGGYWELSHEFAEAYRNPPSKLYDRLVIPNGQGTKALGHAYFLARHLTLSPLNSADYDRMVGLATASPENRVRVLGGAAHMYEGIPVAANSPLDQKAAPVKKMWLFHTSLPVSAVPDGFIFSGVNIAAANHYFAADRRNRNVNTATEAELTEVLQPTYLPENAQKLAQLIILNRNRLNGYSTIDQVILTLRSDEDALEIHLYDSSLDDLKTLLTASYQPSGDDALLPDV
jgi:hypothetical protein